MSCACEPEEPRGRWSRRAVIGAGAAAAVVAALPVRAGAQAEPGSGGLVVEPAAPGTARDYGFLPPRPASEKHVRPIMFPVLADPVLGRPSAGGVQIPERVPRERLRVHLLQM